MKFDVSLLLNWEVYNATFELDNLKMAHPSYVQKQETVID